MKRLSMLLLIALLVVMGALGLRTGLASSRQIDVTPVTDIRVDTVAAAQRMAVAVTYRTVARGTDDVDREALLGLHDFLHDAYPRVAATLTRQTINELSLLYTWPGRDASLPPALLLGHLDVVPVSPGTEDRWTHPPFGGVIEDGFIWGRGTLDDKINVLGLLEAVEVLLRDGFQPERTLLLAFGHDEEVGGTHGAARIAAHLDAQGIAPAFVLDEGMVIADGMLPGLDPPAGMIAIAEKGFLSLELTVEADGGHSSTPPPQTAIGQLAVAITRLQDHPMPAVIQGPFAQLFDHLAPEMGWTSRLILTNRWLFGPLLRRQLARNNGTNASLRTTIAPTIIEGGVKANVLPTTARAVVNFRVHPNDTLASVEAHVARAIDDPAVTIRRHGFATEPSPVSPVEGAGFETIARTIRQIFPDVVVAPTLTVGGTDAKHYVGLTDQVYRFTPMTLGASDLARIHGTNERIGVEDLGHAIAFYYQLIRNACDAAG